MSSIRASSPGSPPFAHGSQLGHHGVEPLGRNPPDQQIGLDVFEQVQEILSPLDRLAPAFGEITNSLQRQDGIDPRRLHDRRRGRNTGRLVLARRHESRTAAGLAGGAPSSDAAGSFGGIDAQGS